jgi:hypothetical protein
LSFIRLFDVLNECVIVLVSFDEGCKKCVRDRLFLEYLCDKESGRISRPEPRSFGEVEGEGVGDGEKREGVNEGGDGGTGEVDVEGRVDGVGEEDVGVTG